MSNSVSDYTKHFEPVMKALTSRGLLLGSYDAASKANLMTIGWGSLGSIWGLPMWVVLVRPSRYTYRCIEHTGCFTVNVPSEALGRACATCGTKSGRDIDKFAACKLDVEKSEYVLAPRGPMPDRLRLPGRPQQRRAAGQALRGNSQQARTSTAISTASISARSSRCGRRRRLRSFCSTQWDP